MRSPATPVPDGDALLAFALRHAAITPYFGSRQHTDRGDYVCSDRVMHDYNLLHVHAGVALWTVAGIDHRLDAGDLIVVPPGAPNRGRSASRVMTLGSLHVMAHLPGGQDVFTLFGVPRVRRVARGSRLDRLFRCAVEEHLPGGDTEALTPHWTALVTKELWRHDARLALLSPRPADAMVAEMLATIEGRIDRPTSLADLARIAGFTPQHLTRRFRRALGVTPMACLMAMRLERSARLLRDGRLTVRAIAESVGFADPAYFSRAFKARFGHSPTAQPGSGNPT
ncbi:MAG TPA: AraC family transcriptional regulator [Planctomycetota bacterium]|nr:AraC family transcriptional regulator [Planctomycetota bacterium]